LANDNLVSRLQATENGAPIDRAILDRVEVQFQTIFEKIAETIQPTTHETIEYREWLDKFPRPGRRFYEQHAEAFNSSQFFKNLLKCLLACSVASERFKPTKLAIDLGAGGGPMSLAAISALGVEKALLIDESAAQLHLARNVGNAMSFSERLSFMRAHIPIDASFQNLNVYSSYWLSENPADAKEIAEAHEGCSSFLIVDTPSIVDSILDKMSEHFDIRSGSVRFSVEHAEAGVEGGGGEFGFVYGSM